MASSSQYPDCVVQLLKNPSSEFRKAASLLVKIARNVQENPEVEKYKSIKIGGRTFMESLLPVDGAVQCLLEMGFVESDDKFVYSDDPASSMLQNIRNNLEKAMQGAQVGAMDQNKPSSSASKSKQQPQPFMQQSERQLFQRLQSDFEHVLVYENSRTQHKARSVIPVETLSKRAEERLANMPEFSSNKGKVSLQYDDCMILELLKWFKYEFFKWMDSPPCENCSGESSRRGIGMLVPTEQERRWGAGRVEGYRCDGCGSELRYPRYNYPEKLLETRSGRCGEWANCFTLLCRSMGYEARHVHDWTDHVWTEVYSKSAGRWIHCDPCENAFDKPLMYEKGWGKKLSLIVAASCDEITDVTWRYVDKVDDVKRRRQAMFCESWLQATLGNMTRKRQVGLPQERKHELELRMVREMVEFISPKVESTLVHEGRTTGSLEWRKARGELGETVEKPAPIFQITGEKGAIRLQYFSQSDKYVTEPEHTPDGISGWKSFADSFSCIERKVEDDWRMVYLARTPSSKTGYICWKFDLNELGKSVAVKAITIKVQSVTFQSGKISWLLSTDKSSHIIESGKTLSFRDEVCGCRVLSLRAFLSGGDGDNAWQHTQLFRENLDHPSEEPQLDITIEYEKEQ